MRNLLLLLSLALCLGCDHKKTETSGPAPVTLTLDWRPEPEFGGFYQAKLAGSFSQHGLNVDIKSGSGDNITWKLVDTGKTDFATASADQVLQARSEGAEVVAIFAVYQTSPQGIMVHAARGLKNIADVFKNPGTLAAEDNAWRKYLTNLYPKSPVQIVGMTEGVGIFLKQPDYSQQCFVTSEPLLAKRQGGDPQSFLVADAGFNPYVTVVITSNKTLRQKPALVSAMTAACREGWRDYLDNPSPANAEMQKLNPDMDAQTFADAAAAQKPLIETDETRGNGLGTMTLERWKSLSQQLIDLKVLDKAPAAEDCFINPK